jgi:hypothetical protein
MTFTKKNTTAKQKAVKDVGTELPETPSKSKPKGAEKFVFELLVKNNQSFKIASTDIIFDEDSGIQRSIRLVRGLNEIFLDEQDDDIATRLGLDRLIFHNRRLEVYATEGAKLAFLRLTDQNADKENRLPGKKSPLFREVKVNEEVHKKSKLVREEQEAVALAIAATDEEMKAFAFTLGIDVEQDIEDLREEFILSAKALPAFFIKHLNDPRNVRKLTIGKALKDNVISLDKVPGQAVWSETSKLITLIPMDKDGKEYLTDFSYTEEGKEFFDVLSRMSI